MDDIQERKKRALKMDKALLKLFPKTKGTALTYKKPFELLVAVILSAQNTDKGVNKVTPTLFKKYKTLDDYVHADLKEFVEDIKSINFRNNKAKNILAAAKKIKEDFKGKIPRTMEEMITIPGVARKTANVVLGNLYGIYEGIAVDTHVRRLSLKYDLTNHTDPKKIEKDLMELLPQNRWFEFGNNLIYFGREYCPARKHDCFKHPVTKIYPPAAEKWPKT